MVDSPSVPDTATGPIKPNPIPTKAAGWIWTIYGSFVVAIGVLFGSVGAFQSGQAAAWVVVIFFIIIGSVFTFIGRQTITGKAKDTLGNGIGSLVLGFLNLVNVSSKEASAGELIGILLGTVTLVTAGVLALYGRSAYKQWRDARTPNTQNA